MIHTSKNISQNAHNKKNGKKETHVCDVTIDQWFLNGFNPNVHNCNDAVCRRIKRENWFRHQLLFRRIGRADGVWFSGTPEQFWGASQQG